MTIVGFEDEIPLWRDLSKNLDQIYEAEKADRFLKTCPFCGKSGVRVETMNTMNGSDKNLRIGFFTCPSCNENWSDLIQ